MSVVLRVPSPCWICVLPVSLPAALRWYADPYARCVLHGPTSLDVKTKRERCLPLAIVTRLRPAAFRVAHKQA